MSRCAIVRRLWLESKSCCKHVGNSPKAVDLDLRVMIRLHKKYQDRRRPWIAICFLVPFIAFMIIQIVVLVLWVGFRAFPEALGSMALVASLPAVISMLLSLREDRKFRPGFWDKDAEVLEENICPKCGYDLRATVEPRCPECGTSF